MLSIFKYLLMFVKKMQVINIKSLVFRLNDIANMLYNIFKFFRIYKDNIQME